jgi:hypothetical protein
MNPEFYQTRMGQKYYEHTLPSLVRQLTRLADLGERVVPLVEMMVEHFTAPGAKAAEPKAEKSR